MASQTIFRTDSQVSQDSTVSAGPSSGVFPKAVTDLGFILGEKVGEGAYATVFKVTSSKMPDKLLACKWFDLTNPDQAVWRDKCLKNEMKIMRKLKHKNVMHAHDVVKTRRQAFIFMNFATNGSIGDYLEKTKKPIEEKKSKKWFRDIMEGLAYLHVKGVAHRDLKPDNFLLDNNFADALLTDFGFAVVSLETPNEKLMRGTTCGTQLYSAPEVLALEDGKVYDAKRADLYSMGVSLFEMLCFNRPFGSEVGRRDTYVAKQKAKKYLYRKGVNLEAQKLCNLLLEPKPEKRLTASDALTYNWFK
ncbi:testis-specific serine/threonine-protein kinase 3-like [Oppia nitens]|uniref:testis-specific serine/threonine-protein kinase 3-like n=1 Tax=Oppia nitens TaxID=1686743 RepID=UPI0023DA9CE0|nr:testis-specific serine/threonine-protein kinase 3-like [Oppia nitens]